jgi:Cdc6-like AAA superfamily ATPase
LSYQKAFDTVYDSALKMMQDPDLTPDLRTKMMPLYSRMLGLASTIEGFRSNQITREVPFYIHLAGKPGVGKTTIAKSLIRFLFPECTEDNLYWRPSNDFWDGFADHRFILYDEFLVGTAET